MGAEAPRAHGDLLVGLWNAAARGRLPHALLLEGPEGIGKYRAALHLARGLLCAAGPAPPCGDCGPCVRTGSGLAPDRGRTNHPDLHVIDPLADGDESIGIGHIVRRDNGPADPLADVLRFRPAEGGWRAALLRDAHRMTFDAQNALLKTLEEPADGTLLVLVTHRSDRLLDTIRSRVVRLRLRRLSAEDTAAVLAEGGAPAERLSELTRWSGGAPGAALQLLREGGTDLRALLVDVASGARDPLAAAVEAWELEGEYPGKTPAAQRRARVRATLDLAVALAADLHALAQGAPPDSLRHGDIANRVTPVGASVRARQLEGLLDACGDVDRNVTPEALLEQALLLLSPQPDPVPRR